MKRPTLRYALGAGVLLVVYLGVVSFLWWQRDFSDAGPLSFQQPGRSADDREASRVLFRYCRRAGNFDLDNMDRRQKVVSAELEGRLHHACYEYEPSGRVTAAVVVRDADGVPLRDVALLKRSGAWPWIGTVKSVPDLVLGALALAAVLVGSWSYYQAARPGPPRTTAWWLGPKGDVLLGVVPVVGWLLLAVLPGRSASRKVRVALQIVAAWSLLLLLWVAWRYSAYPDALGGSVLALVAGGFVYGRAAGKSWLSPPGFGQPDVVGVAGALARPPGLPGPPLLPTTPRATLPSGGGTGLRVVGPEALPTFADVGGMNDVKEELRETLGLLLVFTGEAESYRIRFNGLLLHGPPGAGKTFIVRALAGEYGLRLLQVSVSDVTTKWLGDSARNIEQAFRVAAANVPCVLFIDEFDAIAQRREDEPDQENRRAVDQLLQSLEEYRVVPELIVVAATNHLDQLDEAVVRPGRFDRHIRVDLPDRAARMAIFAAQLRRRPTARRIDLDVMAERTEGLTPAAIAQVVESAALSALRETTAGGQLVKIRTEHLLAALEARGGRDRPGVEEWSWDRLVLDEAVEAELREVQRLIEDPDAARRFGVRPPTGLLLCGPPGTGKTSVARVLAAQGHYSFYPVTAADLTSKWFGESEDLVARLFARARENAPSIIFIDEIDAIASRRGDWDVTDRLLNQVLAEMDGLDPRSRLLVIGATNRPDQLDPALLRGGRLSRVIWLPLPGAASRLRLLRLFTRHMPLGDVDLESLADISAGLSGADLEALCQQAAVEAMMRSKPTREGRGRRSRSARVTGDDFAAALQTVRSSREAVARGGMDEHLVRPPELQPAQPQTAARRPARPKPPRED